eukprot:scpid108839/ scgid19558/ 
MVLHVPRSLFMMRMNTIAQYSTSCSRYQSQASNACTSMVCVQERYLLTAQTTCTAEDMITGSVCAQGFPTPVYDSYCSFEMPPHAVPSAKPHTCQCYLLEHSLQIVCVSVCLCRKLHRP